jgi:hypothetical protein
MDSKTIGFSVVCKDTKRNRAILDSFKLFCEEEANGNYTIGLRLLLEKWEEKEKINQIEEELFLLRGMVDKKSDTEKSDDTF